MTFRARARYQRDKTCFVALRVIKLISLVFIVPKVVYPVKTIKLVVALVVKCENSQSVP